MTTDIRMSRRTFVVGAVLCGLLLLLGGIVGGRLTSPVEAVPLNTSAEAGFARDMQTHHQQAVRMSMEIYGKTGDSDIRRLAYDIATAQSSQAGQMFGWMDTWSLPQTASEPSMTWMSRPVLAGPATTTAATWATNRVSGCRGSRPTRSSPSSTRRPESMPTASSSS